jgi:hypothetical protein
LKDDTNQALTTASKSYRCTLVDENWCINLRERERKKKKKKKDKNEKATCKLK